MTACEAHGQLRSLYLDGELRDQDLTDFESRTTPAVGKPPSALSVKLYSTISWPAAVTSNI
jgi:hypothetical protein